MNSLISPTQENMDRLYTEYLQKTDEELLIFVYGGHRNYATGFAAKKILDERKKKIDDDNHAKLLTAIQKTHWSVIPSFFLLVIAVIISLLSLIISINS